MLSRWITIGALLIADAARAQIGGPPAHTQAPPLVGSAAPGEVAALAIQGGMIERDRPPAETLAEHRRLARSLAAVMPERRGTVEAFVVAAALDSDPVFAREARAAAVVLTRRYHADGHSVVLAGSDGRGGAALPMGSPASLSTVLARVAEVMGKEDVLVLYITSHGAPYGVVYNDGDQGYGAIAPLRLWTMLWQLGIRNRLLMISACYSGSFVPALASETTAILTASSADRTSFGCRADNDWTFFGDALVNHALRERQPLAAAAGEAAATIAGWERQGGLLPSEPQVSIGADAARWLTALETQLPPASAPTGAPATDALVSEH